MGIPKFFRWLTRRYPMILQNVTAEEDCPPVDNLYMDLNSIVHNCIHGNDSKKHEKVSRLADLEDVWADIMRAIDEIVHSVKPRKLILLALDGVAPRAKMNQQRARRFKSAKESEEAKQERRNQGKEVQDLFDSNQISPGTQFMYELGKQLEWFVKYKLNTDPLYQRCDKVLLSDSSVPGEGEHKMMDFIRNLKMEEQYDPNTRHCFYGSDADLIMLSLITHEPHFMIIREEHVVRKTKQGGIQRIDISRTANLQLIHISVLREYFLLEYRPFAAKMRMRFDLERIIDDFVFFCFFIGNDFLPSLSALDISEGSLDHLINFYKKILPTMTDYITCEGQIHWDRAEQFIAMLGKHEHMVFINRVKTLDDQYENAKNIVTFEDGYPGQAGRPGLEQASIVQQRLQAKLKTKKEKKCATLIMNNKQKKYKKQMLLKKYSEDYEERLSKEGDELVKYQSMLEKYKKLRETQRQKEEQPETGSAEEKAEPLHDVIQDIREEYLSDLNPEEVPNSDVSEAGDSELEVDAEKPHSSATDSRTADPVAARAKKSSEQAIEQNHLFMRDFVNTYKQDANEAKRNYYMQKLDFDVKGTKGRKDLHKMLYRYLEGLQWVYFYYYKGAQHWRWYYPYHYAPMISDLGTNIVRDFLGGSTIIAEFKTDEHCKADRTPYTPFQQLLCIFPVKSLRAFLPPQYLTLAEGILQEYFPEDFDIDLNGRTLPWEAAVLIPFVDEDVFIAAEKQLFEEGMRLSPVEQRRNTVQFVYPALSFDRRLQAGPELPSTLRGMAPLQNDRTKAVLQHDYEKVGQFCFPSALLPGVVRPAPDFPSLHWLNVAELEFAEVYVQKVCFLRALVRVPQYKEDTSGADFENWIYDFAEAKLKELYVHFPRQIEAFPLHFEDPYSIYWLSGDASGRVKVTKSRQNKTAEEFAGLARSQRAALDAKGISLIGEINTFATVSALQCLEYDDAADELYKLYSEESMTLPFNMIMKKRAAHHYLSVNERTATPLGRIKAGGQAICFNNGLFGVLATVKGKDGKRGTVKLEIDKEREERKIHDPFVAENLLRNAMSEAPVERGATKPAKKAGDSEVAQRIKDEILSKRYYGDQEIEVLLNLQSGFVNRITGSYLVAYDEVGKDERQVVDIGLNIKNFSKKVHVVEYVRFVAPHKAANTIYDEFQHNQHARGARHVRKHWEYSQECVDTIQEYSAKFPEVAAAINAEGRKGKAMHKLKDLYPGLQKDGEDGALAKLKVLLAYLESLPIGKLPYVEMGFDALDSQLIQRLQDHSEYMLQNYDAVDLGCQGVEQLRTGSVYQEQYPYWFGPARRRGQVADFRVGNRVIAVNSVRRHYLPFGARGTVVGKTEEKLIVLFDEQFLQGTTMYGHCPAYRGAMLEPAHLVNLSRTFATIAQQDRRTLKKFQAKPQKGQSTYGQATAPGAGVQVNHPEQVQNDEGQQIDSSTAIVEGQISEQPVPQSFGRGQRPRLPEAGTQPAGAPPTKWTEAQAFVPAKTMVYKPKAGQPAAEEAANADAGADAGATAAGTGEPNSLQDQIDSSQTAGSASQASQSSALFKPLPPFKLADPTLLATAPEFQKITSLQHETADDKDKKDKDAE